MIDIKLLNKSSSKKEFILNNGPLFVLIILISFFSMTTKNFLSLQNLISIFHNAAPMIILATGVSLVIMTGEIDISVGTNMFLSTGIGMVLVVRYGFPEEIGILLTLVVGILFGALNGFIVVILEVNPLIATMGTMIAMRGLALNITKGMIITLPESLRVIGSMRIGYIYFDIILSLIVLIIFHGFHTRTVNGRHITAVGNGKEIAQKAGVRVRYISFLTFIISGFLASLAGLIAIFQVGGVSITFGQGNEFTAIAIAVIGGISLFGGEGNIFSGIILGAIILMVIQSGLNFIGASPYLYSFIQGCIIFLAMYVQSLKNYIQPTFKMLDSD